MRGLIVLVLSLLVAAVVAKDDKEHLRKGHSKLFKKYDHHFHHHTKLMKHGHHDKDTKSKEKEPRGIHHSPEETRKNTKFILHHAPLSLSQHEARIQGDMKTNRKAIREHHIPDEKQDLHLQDLNFEQARLNPHQFQRGHHSSFHHHPVHRKEQPSKQQHQGHQLFFNNHKPGKVGEARAHDIHELMHPSSFAFPDNLHKVAHPPKDDLNEQKEVKGKPLYVKKAFDKGKKPLTKKHGKKHPKTKKHFDW